MLKKLLLILILVLSLPAYSGTYETAYNTGSPVFLYIYTNNCSYCRQFEPLFSELEKKHTDYKFVKVNAATQYGQILMAEFGGIYVPFIVLSSKKTHKAAVISPKCALNNVCTENALKNFKS